MFERWTSYSQIGDLRRDQSLTSYRISDYDRRAKFPIAVIDDRPFEYEQNLKANGYKIETFNDLRSIDEISQFSIILCDLQGVGRFLSQKGQGAFIIDEIKRRNPEKFVIAYTGGALDDSVTIKAQEVADFFLKKDQDIDDWRDKLDFVTRELADPIEVWNRQRDALIDADVPTLDILKLEDAYVRSIQSRDPTKYVNVSRNVALSSDLRAIAQSLVASGIFKVLIG